MKVKTNLPAGEAGPTWPVLTTYDQEHLSRIALPLGGIGTGTISLGGRGDLRDWEVMNRPAKGFSPAGGFFALWAKPAGGKPVTRALEGPLPESAYEGHSGSPAANSGLPRFRKCSFAAAYPLGQVMLSDPDVPLDVRLEAFNPMVPVDPDASGIPVAILRYVLVNKTARSVTATVCGSVPNFVGPADAAAQRKNRFKKARGVQGLVLGAKGLSRQSERYGTMALATTASAGVTCRTAWGYSGVLDFWDDLSDDGRLDERKAAKNDIPFASLAARVTVPPRGSKAVTFLVAWHFPNRLTWTPAAQDESACCSGGDCINPADYVGNYYCTQYKDAWDVVAKTAPRLKALEADTCKFVGAFCRSDLPAVAKEAALYTLTALRTQTTFRTEDGLFWGFEGCGDTSGCCHGNCNHVWNYEQGTAFLYGGLARKMREVEFLHATRDTGHMSFRVSLPIDRAQEAFMAAADGQMGCLMRLYRDWQLSGDDAMLREIWPKAKKVLAFAWVPGGWDADQDGVMEGCQHNTMDVEYYGPNPQMTGWYLGALRACEEMARYLGDDDFADRCRRLFDSGSKWMDENLFNGDYYEHQIRPARKESNVAPGLKYSPVGPNLHDPQMQLGPGCLIDQLVGQYMAHVLGLGYLHKPRQVRKTLGSIAKYNRREGFWSHFNNMRTYALNDETALVMADYTHCRRPKRPFPYYNEVMTGFEYAAAVGMLQEGMTAEGLRCIADVRSRYDGKKRSPFNEAECGHHYARAMTAWAAVLALTGFHYSGVTGTLEFAATDKASEVFWSNGYAWGTFRQKPARSGCRVEITVLYGSLRIRRLILAGVGTIEIKPGKTVGKGRTARLTVKRASKT